MKTLSSKRLIIIKKKDFAIFFLMSTLLSHLKCGKLNIPSRPDSQILGKQYVGCFHTFDFIMTVQLTKIKDFISLNSLHLYIDQFNNQSLDTTGKKKTRNTHQIVNRQKKKYIKELQVLLHSFIILSVCDQLILLSLCK